MNGVQVIQYAQFNAKMTKFCVILDKIQEDVTIQINAYQKEQTSMAMNVLELVQYHATNPNKSFAMEEYFPMDATSPIFVLTGLWITKENYVQEFVHQAVNKEKLFSQH